MNETTDAAADGAPASFASSHDACAAGTAARPAPPGLTRRSEFLRAARGRKAPGPAFMLQGWNRHDDGPPRIGFTCSKKVGNAVARNRAKRRLREAARLVLPDHGRPGWDYVLVGRRGDTASRPFTDLCADLERALARLHG